MRDVQINDGMGARTRLRLRVRASMADSFAMIAGLMLLTLAAAAADVGIRVSDTGAGGDYISGTPIVLPAAGLCTNLFGDGALPIKNRRHNVQPAAFDSAGELSHSESAKPSPFPEYLKGNPYVWFSQEVRRYTNYACTVSVDAPVTFYLVVDNRVNDFSEGSELDDPTFGPPDTEWIPRDGWRRVNTGISPQLGNTNRPDYLSIYEGGVGVGAVSQFYAIYSRTFTNGGEVTLHTQFQGNMYCLVVATNLPVGAAKTQADQKPAKPGTGG